MGTGLIDPRKNRGLVIVQAKGKQIREVIEGKYLVPSATQPSGSYFVDLQARSCSCPDWETLGGHGREHTCKHLYAVLIVRREITMPDGTSVVVSEENHVVYPQHPNYRRSRMAEKAVFETLLHSLCAGIEQPVYKGNGRPALPLSDVIFAGALKVYSTLAMDRVTSDLATAQEKKLVEVVPHPNTTLRVLRQPGTVPILRRLIEESTIPLKTIEVDFAADATGIAAKQYVRWFDKKWGKERREKKWLKLHIICGVTTTIITGAEVTTGNRNDSPFLPQLVTATAKNFTMREVALDKGYLAHKNFRAIANVGAEPFVPFKPNSVGDTRDPLWNRLHAYFTLNRDDFKAHYHKRSLSETTFSTIKRVLGSAVRAKSFDGQVSEIYLKVLAHNIRVLVRAIFELGIDPKFWTPKGELPPPPTGAVR